MAIDKSISTRTVSHIFKSPPTFYIYKSENGLVVRVPGTSQCPWDQRFLSSRLAPIAVGGAVCQLTWFPLFYQGHRSNISVNLGFNTR